jgi:5'-nucleotidase
MALDQEAPRREPRIVLTNDDGIEAPGIEALRKAAEGLGRCYLVAPDGPASGCGHQVTTHQPIKISRLGGDRVAVAGTPADCVRLALHHLAADVEWVLSGINSGGNLGTDVYHSGTVAAVREAVIRGVPGIAVSHYIARGRTIDWTKASERARRVLVQLMSLPIPPGVYWNVNLPHLDDGAPEPEVVFCPPDPSPLPLDFLLESEQAHYVGNYQGRARRPGADVEICFGGRIAVSMIHVFGPERPDLV